VTRRRRPPLRLAAALALALAGCGEEAPDPTPGQAASASFDLPKTVSRPAGTLRVTGRWGFEGGTRFHCATDGADGLQVSLRTGDRELPVVALRLEGPAGEGRHRARLFVTGRSPSGALARGTGEAAVDLRREERPGEAPVLRGAFEGAYAGHGGRGRVRGRFGPCALASNLVSTPFVASREDMPEGVPGT
jgi:hypothetical protein